MREYYWQAAKHILGTMAASVSIHTVQDMPYHNDDEPCTLTCPADNEVRTSDVQTSEVEQQRHKHGAHTYKR
jgi:hypothetical protein